MACSGDDALIDFNSPDNRRAELQTPLVPIPKTCLEIDNLVSSAGENPFDLVVEQINCGDENDPFELVFEEARKSCKVTKSDTLELIKKSSNVFPGSEVSVLEQSGPGLDSISDSVLNASIMSSGLFDEKFDDFIEVDEEKRIGELIEQELHRSFELVGGRVPCLEKRLANKYNSLGHEMSNAIDVVQTPLEGNMQAIIADRIHKCIQRGLNDSRTNLTDAKHHRSFSSPLKEYDDNVSILAAVSCATGLNFKRGSVSSFELFESPHRVKKESQSIEINSITRKDSSGPIPDTKLLEKFNLLKNSVFKNGSSSKLSRSFSDVAHELQLHSSRNMLERELNPTGATVLRAGTHRRHRSVILKRGSVPDIYSLDNKNLSQIRSSSGYLKNHLSDLCLSSTPVKYWEGANGVTTTKESQHNKKDDLNDSVFLEAKSLSCLFKHKADHGGGEENYSDEEDNFLSGRLEVPTLCSATSDSELDEPISQSKDNEEKPNLSRLTENNSVGRLLNGRRSYDGLLLAEGQSSNDQNVLRHSNSNSSSTSILRANSVPELSQEGIQHLQLRTHSSRKIQLPVLVPPLPVPMMGNKEVADKRLKPLKAPANLEPVKKGPMKAMLPLGNMMRNPAKKVSPTGSRNLSARYSMIKSRINTSGVKLLPMAQSTPEANRKGTSILQALKMCSPIPHDTAEEPQTSKCMSSNLPTLGTEALRNHPPQVALQSSKSESVVNQGRTRSLGCGEKITSSGAVNSVQQNKPQRRLKSASNLQQIKRPAVTKPAPQNSNSAPLKLLTKNSHTGKPVPPIKPGLQVTSNLKKGSVSHAEKENVRPVSRVKS